MFKFTIVLIALSCVVHFTRAQSRCTNPNNRRGVCLSVYDCPVIFNLLSNSPLPGDQVLFIQRSQCANGSGRTPYVCCTEDSNFATTQGPTRAPVNSRPAGPSNGLGNVLPTANECGQIPLGNKIYSGRNTGIDEYPWMALFEYVDATGKREFNCAGSLINTRYIVTAAHCLSGLPSGTRLTKIRLGEHDISKDLDCETGNDCADPVLDVGVEETITHESYNPQDKHKFNDIALIRLNQDIAYTGFIKPVCLPSATNLARTASGANLTVAGWGRTLNSKRSNIKQKLEIPVVDGAQCRNKFRTRTININPEGQICAGGRYIEDSCDGDSGGPLMKRTNNRMTLEGVVSYGASCGLEGWPGVYTRVSSYENWVGSKLRP